MREGIKLHLKNRCEILIRQFRNSLHPECIGKATTVIYAEESIMSDLILELQNRRDQLQKNAEIHKRKRDELNDMTKEWSRERDQLNQEIRGIIGEANEHRSRRDQFNEEVQKHKVQRDLINKDVSVCSSVIAELRKDITPMRDQIPLSRLKRDLRDLEFKQMTSSLTSDKEKELVEKLKQLSQTIREREETEQTPEIKVALERYEQARERAEEEHTKLQEIADKAQSEHDRMLELYKMSEKLIKRADKAQASFVRSKLDADKEHNTTMRLVKQIHEIDKIIMGLKIKQKYSQRSRKEVDNRIEAKEIFKKFRDGEKLSTEDIMLLQKTGFL